MTGNYFYLYIAGQVTEEAKGVGAGPHFPLVDGWMYTLSSFQPLQSLHTGHEVFLCPTAFHTFSFDCKVPAIPNGFRLCVASVHLLSARPHVLVDAMIRRQDLQRCMCTSLPPTTLQYQAAQSGMESTIGCLTSLLFADDTLTSLSSH